MTPTKNSFGARLIEFIIRWRLWMLAVAFIFSALAIQPAMRLTFDQSIESLYAENDPRLLDYRQSKSWFGGDDFVFIAYTDPELLSPESQSRLAQLTEQIKELPGIAPNSVQSFSQLMKIGRNPLLRRHPERLMEFGRSVVIGEDQKTTAIMCRLDSEGESRPTHAETIAALRKIAADQPLRTYVVGEPVLVYEMFRYAEQDGARMGWAAAGVLSLVILFLLRDLRSVILPLIVVQFTILWTKAVLSVSHMQLTMVSSILTSLVTIIGVSTVVYTSLYYQSLRNTLDPEPALRRMLKVLGLDIVWVCLATATGFSAQLTSHLHPVRSFGITMVIGSLFVLVAMVMVLPGGLLLGAQRQIARRPRGQAQVKHWLLAVTEWVLRHRRLVWSVAGLLLILSLTGLQRLRIETDFSKNFLASSPVRKSLEFLEKNLGGAGIWEVNFPAPNQLTSDFIDQVRDLADELRALNLNGEPALTKVMAASDGLDLVPRVPFFIRNFSEKEARLNQMQPEFLPSLYQPAAGRMRIMLRAHEGQQSKQKEKLIAKVTEVARNHFPESNVTGLYVLLTYLIESLLHDQWIDLLTAASGLIVMMSLAYRSIRLGVISLIPNVLPMVMLLGGMGWCGVPVNIGTAMICSDAMGLTIHDSIFYLSAYRRARLAGLDFREALREVQLEVRQPLVYSNVALILGFLVLTISHFVPLIYFGVLVSVAIAGGLAINLLLLPLLLEWDDFFRKQATRLS